MTVSMLFVNLWCGQTAKVTCEGSEQVEMTTRGFCRWKIHAPFIPFRGNQNELFNESTCWLILVSSLLFPSNLIISLRLNESQLVSGTWGAILAGWPFGIYFCI
ncbi:hypothetical protein TREMEDRAFT_61191 [Tremella mesenterica DSM 1558]|uniref:uncharacterized protein n=1 Tax=Tremella mesenterica (strain ATCC 24925 / CBS 8224 / DSM 1558 / NBRC 9311 / NRRL Y-6157 / RJB 2259-6 / UBC 559-6) TaxID=578456 RepID=UPI0003F49DE8|nr:uncharacterized protein TREMEDRAFT_61191 [Tremella mesenterica DSM 1558]EIW70684.1 hypothetical protein TREMEDRAFT_61191 [Tremella mesenterica DSM 1558]